MNFPILSSLILLPTVGALFLFFTKSKKENNLTVKYVALFTSLVNFFLSIYLWILFDQSTSEFQFVENRIWIENLVNYKVGIDGISILFVILTTFITPLCIISVNNSIKERLREVLMDAMSRIDIDSMTQNEKLKLIQIGLTYVVPKLKHKEEREEEPRSFQIEIIDSI